MLTAHALLMLNSLSSKDTAPVPLKRRSVELLIANFKPILDDFVRVFFGSDDDTTEDGFILKDFYSQRIFDMDDWDHGKLKKSEDAETLVAQQASAIVDIINDIVVAVVKNNLVDLSDNLIDLSDNLIDLSDNLIDLPDDITETFMSYLLPIHILYRKVEGLDIPEESEPFCGCVTTYIVKRVLANFSLLLQTVCDDIVDTEDTLYRLFEFELKGAELKCCPKHNQIDRIGSMIAFLSESLCDVHSIFTARYETLLKKANAEGKYVYDSDKDDIVTPEGWRPLDVKNFLFPKISISNTIPDIRNRITDIMSLITNHAFKETDETRQAIVDAIKVFSTDFPNVNHNFDDLIVQIDAQLAEIAARNSEDSKKSEDASNEKDADSESSHHEDSEESESEDVEDVETQDTRLLKRKREACQSSHDKPAVRYSQIHPFENIYDDNLPRAAETVSNE